jgi:hypothetical protein
MQGSRPQKAVVALPEFSTTPLLSNLFNYRCVTGDRVILIDRQDFDRIKRLATDSEKYLRILIVIKRLYNLNFIDIIDYSMFYDPPRREMYIERNKQIRQSVPDRQMEYLNRTGFKDWIYYARGEYQVDIREALSEDMKEFGKEQKNAWSDYNKLENDTAGTELIDDSFEKVLNKVTTSANVMKQVNKSTNVPYQVTDVIANPQYEIVKEVVTEHKDTHLNEEFNIRENLKNPAGPYNNEVLDIDADHILHETQRLSSEMATELTGENDQKIVLGPHLGFIGSLELDIIEHNFNNRTEKEIKEEAKKALEELKTIDIGPTSSENLARMAEYAHENLYGPDASWKDHRISKMVGESVINATRTIFPVFTPKTIRSEINKKVQSLRLNNRIDELSDNYRHAPLLIAAAVRTDPIFNQKHSDRHLSDWLPSVRGWFISPKESDERWLSTQGGVESWVYSDRWYEQYDLKVA